MKSFPLKIVTPDGPQFEGEATELIVRTISGDMGIMAGHINCVTSLGMGRAVVVTEDSVNLNEEKFSVNVLNQWTYHSRLYSAAKFVAECGDPNVNLVQLVSFGCGVDAITTDEVRSILQSGGRLYTQLKIDEISNPGAVRIRLRSLFAALDQ